MTTVSLPQRVSVSNDVLFQEISGECVLLNMASEQYFGLDDVGTRIWQLLAEHGDTSIVLNQLKQDYDADEDILRDDLANLIHDLNTQGLVNV